MDEAEARRIENAIREEAQKIALALADYPEFAVDLRDTLRDSGYGVRNRDELIDFHPIGGVDDMQSDPGDPDYRRARRLAELSLALDEIRPRQR